MALIFKANPAGIRALLRSPHIAADLEARAKRVAQHANGLGDGDELYVAFPAEIGPRRARAAVITANAAAMIAEAREHRLAHAVDAAR